MAPNDEITLTPPWRLHADAARILMRIYPNEDSLRDLSEILEQDNAAVIAVRNAGRAYLASVQAMLELESLIKQYRSAGYSIQPGFMQAVGEALLQFIAQEEEAGARAIQIHLPKRAGAPYWIPRGVRGMTPLDLLQKALKPKK